MCGSVVLDCLALTGRAGLIGASVNRLHVDHDHYVARVVGDSRSDGGIAHDSVEGVCRVALAMLDATGRSVEVVSRDASGVVLETLHRFQPAGS